ncbi:MAG TPA: hypothetical protein VKV03_19580 [Candidatus Binataceae bacterium]|nr:hypothetical protein [Candidatus Binataceae bacterium]
MKRVMSLCLTIVLAMWSLAAQNGAQLSQSWRPPTAADLGSADDQKWREENPARYLVVTGDFDGDGKPDEARLMVRGDGKAFALFVKLAARDAAQKLDEFPDVSKLPAMGIKRVAPDRYPTACARGLDCAEDEPRYIIVKHDAIDYFRHDQSNRYYYWNESRHAFAQVGIND